MKRISLLAAIAFSFAAAGTAWADDITIDTAKFQSLKSREQVQQELVAHKARGINPWASGYNLWNDVPALRSRDAVRAEAIAARGDSEAAALVGEDSGSAYLAHHRQAPLPNTPAATRTAGR